MEALRVHDALNSVRSAVVPSYLVLQLWVVRAREL